MIEEKLAFVESETKYTTTLLIWIFHSRLRNLPLVCKRWVSLLQQPSAVWEHVLISYPTNYGRLKKWIKPRAAAVQQLDVRIADHVGPDFHTAALLVGSLITVAINSTKLSILRLVGGNRLDMDCGKWLPNLVCLKELYLEERNPNHMRFFPSWFLHMNHLTGLTSLEIRGDDYDLPFNGSKEYRALPAALVAMKGLQTLKLENLGICAFAETDFTDDVIHAIASLPELK